MIVEGVLVLDALVHIGRKADFVVFVTGGTGIALASQLADYRMRRKLPDRADFTIDGYIDYTGAGLATRRCAALSSQWNV